jgi:hypothetical protein
MSDKLPDILAEVVSRDVPRSLQYDDERVGLELTRTTSFPSHQQWHYICNTYDIRFKNAVVKQCKNQRVTTGVEIWKRTALEVTREAHGNKFHVEFIESNLQLLC